DRRALKVLQERYGLATLSDAIRFSIRIVQGLAPPESALAHHLPVRGQRRSRGTSTREGLTTTLVPYRRIWPAPTRRSSRPGRSCDTPKNYATTTVPCQNARLNNKPVRLGVCQRVPPLRTHPHPQSPCPREKDHPRGKKQHSPTVSCPCSA